MDPPVDPPGDPPGVLRGVMGGLKTFKIVLNHSNPSKSFGSSAGSAADAALTAVNLGKQP